MMLCGNALALHGRDFPTQRCLQPLNFGFAAFDHLFPPNQIVKRIIPRRPRVISVAPARENPRFKRLWRWYEEERRSTEGAGLWESAQSSALARWPPITRITVTPISRPVVSGWPIEFVS